VTSIHRSAQGVIFGTEVLAQMRALAPSLVFASLLTDDGFVVAQTRADTVDSGRFGSMASSVQALSEAVARELHLGTSSYVVIAAQGGHVLQQRVPGHPVILAALFDDAETLGKALSTSRRGAETLAAQFDTLHPVPETIGSTE